MTFYTRRLLPALLLGTVATIPALADDSVALEEIIVTGRRVSQSDEAIGLDKTTSTVAVTREALLSAPSGISGLKMLENLPGFNVQTDGALGLYEFGNSVQTRAFNLDQIGFVVDGIPTGRSDAFGGSPVFRYVDNENLGVVEASAGAGDVSLPSYSSLGPLVQYRSIAPQDEAGVFISQTFGEDSTRRTFIRASTGQIGPVKAYVSRTKLDSDLWRGAGTIDREHWEAQAHVSLGEESWARLKFVSNDFFDYDSPTLSRAQYHSGSDVGGKSGRDRGYIRLVPNSTPGFTPTVAGVPYSNPNYTYDYALAVNIRNDKLYGATTHFGLWEDAWLESTAYWEDKDGYGVSPDGYANSLSRYTPQAAVGLPVTAPRGVQYGLSGVGGDRYGLTSKLQAKLDNHTLEAGFWVEHDKYHRTQARYNTVDGSPEAAPNLNELVYLRRNYRSERDTIQIFLKDSIALLDDDLTLDIGAKGLFLDYDFNGYRDFADYYRIVGGRPVAGYGPQRNSASYNDGFLPQVGLVYRLDGRTQLFASYSENMALPKGMDDIFATALASSNAAVPAPAPERAKNVEIGIRTNQAQFYAALSGYYTRFANRIQSITTLLPGTVATTETFYANVGRVEAYGAEFTGTFKPDFLNNYAYANFSVTYNHATFLDDIPTSPVTPTSGRFIPDSAKWIIGGGITVEPTDWLVANFSGRYVGKRWSTFTNTPGSSLPGYTVFSAYVDVGEGWDYGPLKNIKARVNIDNIFDKDTLSFISPAVSGDGNFRPLSPRTIQVTISGEF